MKYSLVLGATLTLTMFATGAMATDPKVDLGPAKFKIESTTSEITATVVGVDHENRVITIKGPEGNTLTTKVDDDVLNFKKVKKGDKVEIEMYQSTAVSLKKNAKKMDIVQEKTQTVLNAVTKKKKPVKVETEQVRQIADITAVNAAKGTVTLVGLTGEPVEISVKDPKNLEGVQKGDQVEIIYTEAVAYEVTKK